MIKINPFHLEEFAYYKLKVKKQGKGRHNNFYTVYNKSRAKSITYFGTIHTEPFESYQVEQIESLLDSKKYDTVFVEGKLARFTNKEILEKCKNRALQNMQFATGDDDRYEKLFQNDIYKGFSEGVWAWYLCNNKGIKCIQADMTNKEIGEVLLELGYTKSEVF
jgi:hypothetical protein